MSGGKCAICGIEEREQVSEFSIIPEEISEQVDLKERTVSLCRNCRYEMQRWFLSKIAQTAYDEMAKEFRPKSAQRLASEYETAYRWFVKIKTGADAETTGKKSAKNEV